MTTGAAARGINIARFAVAFTAVFWISQASRIVGSLSYFAAIAPADFQKFGIGWSLRLTNEGGLIVALLAGLPIGNFLPGVAERIKDAARPEAPLLPIEKKLIGWSLTIGVVSLVILFPVNRLMF